MAYLCKVEICGVDTSKLPILNSEQMLVLFRQYQNGDKDAREQHRTRPFSASATSRLT